MKNFFGFRTKYEFVCQGEVAGWKNLQMAQWGAPVDIETTDISPFSNTHQLCSSYTPKLGAQPLGMGLLAHVDYIVDTEIPSSRLALCQSVWKYLSTLGPCEGNCTSNSTFCTISGCQSLSTIYTGPADPCGCTPGSVNLNPGFLAVVIVIPLAFILILVGAIIGCICHFKPACCDCCYKKS